MGSPWSQAVLFSQGAGNDDSRNHWGTPPEVFDPLHLEFGFGLDAAATLATAKVQRYVGPGSHLAPDAFKADWSALSGGDAVWLNSPYGRGVHRWMALANRWGQRVTVCVLVFARTDTRWWWDSVFGMDGAVAAEVRFKKGRIKFIDPRTGKPGDAAPAPSCLVVYRPGYAGQWPKLGEL